MSGSKPAVRGEHLLAEIIHPDRPILYGQTLVVVAHPDDETLACGALLSRLADLAIVLATDGAPANGDDARSHSFANPADYGTARREELRAALAAGGVRGARLFEIGLPDQGAAFALADIARQLVHRVRAAERVFTHAYEGGHPDHDACAFAVRAAAALVQAAGEEGPVIVDMPLYRADTDGGWLRQAPPGVDGAVLRLSDDERRRKAAMMAAYASQAATLSGFGPADEPYRIAAGLAEFDEPPNGGRVLYDGYEWGMTGAGFVARARSAARDLGLPAAA